jgi:IS1 family transposase
VNDPPEYGDCWTYTALKRDSGFFISFSCGKRTKDTCKIMLDNLFDVMDLPFPGSKISFSTDGNKQYEELIKEMYCETCMEYGQIIKERKENRVVKIRYETIFGNIAWHKISTSVVEGYNNKMRQKIACFVRKTAAFSKLMQSHILNINIFKFYNNFIETKMERKWQKTEKKRTPAMIEGIENHVWTWREFL